MRKRIAFGLLAIALLIAAGLIWRAWQLSTFEPVAVVKEDEEVANLIEQLREPSNKVRDDVVRIVIPGGEIIDFSPPMMSLIRLGDRSRTMLHGRINDAQIQNEVVLILGAIGDATTVPLLIEAYPYDDVRPPDSDRARWKAHMCFTFALTYLTSEPIGRSRQGADYNPQNKRLWQEWWRENQATFIVRIEKPNATWVPFYPKP